MHVLPGSAALGSALPHTKKTYPGGTLLKKSSKIRSWVPSPQMPYCGGRTHPSTTHTYTLFPRPSFPHASRLLVSSKSPEHTHTPQTPTRTELAHSTRTKRTDPVYGSVSLSATRDRCGAERWIALARQRASSVKPSMREFSRQMTAETWRS